MKIELSAVKVFIHLLGNTLYSFFSEKLSVLLNINLSTATFSLQQTNEHRKLMLHGTPGKKASCLLQKPAHTSKCITLRPKDGLAYLNDLYFHCISSYLDFDTSWQLYHFFIIKCSRKS